MGSPIRKSPDHRLLASPRGLSQLATSFIAYLRQGIHTHALSSLTIKFTLDTEYLKSNSRIREFKNTRRKPEGPESTFASAHTPYIFRTACSNLCCPSIF